MSASTETKTLVIRHILDNGGTTASELFEDIEDGIQAAMDLYDDGLLTYDNVSGPLKERVFRVVDHFEALDYPVGHCSYEESVRALRAVRACVSNTHMFIPGMAARILAELGES